MIRHQYYLRCLAHASYLIGDEDRRVAAVVDPQRDQHGVRDVADLVGGIAAWKTSHLPTLTPA